MNCENSSNISAIDVEANGWYMRSWPSWNISHLRSSVTFRNLHLVIFWMTIKVCSEISLPSIQHIASLTWAPGGYIKSWFQIGFRLLKVFKNLCLLLFRYIVSVEDIPGASHKENTLQRLCGHNPRTKIYFRQEQSVAYFFSSSCLTPPMIRSSGHSIIFLPNPLHPPVIT